MTEPQKITAKDLIKEGTKPLAGILTNEQRSLLSEPQKSEANNLEWLDEIFSHYRPTGESLGHYKDIKLAITAKINEMLISELDKIEKLTHEGRGTILWEMDAICDYVRKRKDEVL